MIYADAAYDITDEVMAEINKDRPAPPVAAAPATSGARARAAAAPAAEPTVTVPGLAPKK